MVTLFASCAASWRTSISNSASSRLFSLVVELNISGSTRSTMATLVSTSPTVVTPISRQLSSASSDDSSLYELSFDYTKDEDGNIIRVSKPDKKRQSSLSSTPAPLAFQSESPVDLDPSPLISASASSNNNGSGGFQIPRRSSLSRSESTPGPNEWDHNREFKRTISTPAAYPGHSRPKSVLGMSDSSLHNKENEHAPLCESSHLRFLLARTF